MANKFWANIPSHRITAPEAFFDRRRFLSKLGGLGLGLLATPALFRASETAVAAQSGMLQPPFERPDVFPATRNQAYTIPSAIERRDLMAREIAASHNNFYEFLPGQGGPAWRYAGDFEVEPWQVQITGECEKPTILDLDDLFAFEHEERVYHFRCVEQWAMNVPWSGFPLSRLLATVAPLSSARFVRFTSSLREDQMPGAKESPWYPWPYHEALRMDEAMNELAMVVTGVYGEPLLKQHGSPVRIIVPWKYGYKSPKSIIRIELVRDEPTTFWQIHPHEYGFLSNINPNIPHPRWSQAQSFWLDTQVDPRTGDPTSNFPTLIFNGYEQYVASLYPDEPREPQRPLRQGQIAR